MKLSTRLAWVVGCAALGALVLVVVALQIIRSSMIEERRNQIELMVSLAGKQVNLFVAQEKSGKLSHEEAQARAKQALSGLRQGDDYVFVRQMDGLVVVHPDSRKEGQIDLGSKGPDGRTLMQVYVDSLKSADQSMVEIKTKRPKGEVEVAKLNGLVKIPEWNWIVGFGLFIDDIDEAYAAYALRFGLIGLVIFAVVVSVAVFMARRIYRVLGGEPDQAASLAGAIAGGDLTQRVDGATVSGSLIESVERMRGSLHDIIGHIQESAGRVGDASASLSGQMEQINNAAKQSSEAVSSTAAAIEELAVSVDHISQSSRETEENSTRATQLANQGQELVHQASAEIERAASRVSEATELIGGLVERSREIGGIAQVIKEIADQTNLLALNAAIEAARAGEQGRGFAVVADEVRKLAERTGQATDQITGMIQAIHRDTERVVDGMGQVGPQVTRGVEIAAKAGDALRQINEATAIALGKVSDVAAATTEQSQASSSVARNVEQISSMLEESAQSVHAANDNVLALEQLAVDLRQSVQRFKV
ncbi:methyl-accepting chemotaxis protein [Propionivibrio soli]|uniref:methyl-accepting chemotaxis protein n=1 Tax=Propionivibrio soli TaxID=2976531 RepID=UPI0021E7D0EE|nr:methyl-accepting chemotaxis protein [Propionivibrio soli]